MRSAAELLDRGRIAANEGRHRQARELLRLALRRSTGANERAAVLSRLAIVEEELGQRRQAREIIKELLSTPGLEPQVHMVAIGQGANLHLRAGEFTQALNLFNRAIDGLHAHSPERANFELSRGMCFLLCNEPVNAVADFRSAAGSFQNLGDDLGNAKALHNLGYALMLTGDLASALWHMNAVAPTLDSISPTVNAINLQDRAEVLLRAGRTREASQMLHEASRVFGSRSMVQLQGECELVAARAELHIDPRQARRKALQAARRLRNHGSESWALKADSVATIAQSTLRIREPWLTDADRLSQNLIAHGLRHEAQILDLHAASVAVDRGELDLAQDLLKRGRTKSTDSLTERLLERLAKARLSIANGRRKTALNHLRAGLELLQHWQASFGSLDLMSSVSSHGRDLARLGVELALDDGSPTLAFEWSERARSLTTRIVPVRPPDDPLTAEQLMEIRQLTIEEPLPGTRTARRLAELREQVRQRAWLGRGSGEIREIARLTEVRDALGEDTVLVSYLWDGSQLAALLVTPTDVALEHLGDSTTVSSLLKGLQADLDMNAAMLTPSIARVVDDSVTTRLARLGEILVDPLLDRIGDRRLIITQAGLVSGVPWPRVPGLIGRPLCVAATASSWLETRGTPVVGTTGFVAGPKVPRAAEEVLFAAPSWPDSIIVTGSQATTAATLDLAGRVDMLHISAHGHHSADNPLFSGVELIDGALYGYDIDRLSTVPSVVILSACEVGRSTQRWAEESLGMVNAWLHAGARCVIASAAAVADDQACEILKEVHQHMAAGVPPAVALAVATEKNPSTFTCFGAGW